MREKEMKMTLLTLLTFLGGLSCGCFKRSAPEPIVVHVFRDPAAAEIDLALRATGKMQLKTWKGKPILVATMETTSYAEGLTILGHQAHPEIVFLASLEDGARAEIDIPPQSAVQVSRNRFYLVIPSWASGEQREAAELVVAAVRQELQKAGAST
jgi:hypothetical protein